MRAPDRIAGDERVTDEDQLARLGLPVWKTERDVADAHGISIGML